MINISADQANAIRVFIRKVLGISYTCTCGHVSYSPSAAQQHAGDHFIKAAQAGIEAGRKKQ